jgi:hypothetical protein
MYTGLAPLIRLYNFTSVKILDSLGDRRSGALVFHACHDKFLSHPFDEPALAPDIMVLCQSPGYLKHLTGKYECHHIKQHS